MIHLFQRTAHSHRRMGRWSVVAVGLLGLAGCNLLRSGKHEQEDALATASAIAGPSKFHHRVSQYIFLSDFALNKNSAIFQELSDLRDQVFKELHLPESNRLIQVYLFEDQEKYEKYMRGKYPDLPVRRAFFIEQPRIGTASDLMVFTYWGDTIRQDLRHELTHGLVHSVLHDVPIWLDEGLAEVYELPPDRNGINVQHLKDLRKAPVLPDLARLEKLTLVNQMDRPEYREAWAWVHWMLRDSPEAKTVLLSYLQQLRAKNTATNSLASKLKEVYPNPNETMSESLMQIKLPATARGSSQR